MINIKVATDVDSVVMEYRTPSQAVKGVKSFLKRQYNSILLGFCDAEGNQVKTPDASRIWSVVSEYDYSEQEQKEMQDLQKELEDQKSAECLKYSARVQAQKDSGLVARIESEGFKVFEASWCGNPCLRIKGKHQLWLKGVPAETPTVEDLVKAPLWDKILANSKKPVSKALKQKWLEACK